MWPGGAFGAEFTGTFMVVFTVFGVTHRQAGASVGSTPVPAGPDCGPARHPAEDACSTFTPAVPVPAVKEPRSHR